MPVTTKKHEISWANGGKSRHDSPRLTRFIRMYSEPLFRRKAKEEAGDNTPAIITTDRSDAKSLWHTPYLIGSVAFLIAMIVLMAAFPQSQLLMTLIVTMVSGKSAFEGWFLIEDMKSPTRFDPIQRKMAVGVVVTNLLLTAGFIAVLLAKQASLAWVVTHAAGPFFAAGLIPILLFELYGAQKDLLSEEFVSAELRKYAEMRFNYACLGTALLFFAIVLMAAGAGVSAGMGAAIVPSVLAVLCFVGVQWSKYKGRQVKNELASQQQDLAEARANEFSPAPVNSATTMPSSSLQLNAESGQAASATTFFKDGSVPPQAETGASSQEAAGLS